MVIDWYTIKIIANVFLLKFVNIFFIKFNCEISNLKVLNISISCN